ncbi:TPA: bacteriocin immunity protein, partial [Streptococcus pneumoniae]
LVNRELLLNPKHPAPELLNLARFVKREEAKYRGTATSALMYEELFKML